MAIITEKQSERFERLSTQFTEALIETEKARDNLKYHQECLNQAVKRLNEAESRLLQSHSKMGDLLNEVEGRLTPIEEIKRRINLPLTTANKSNNISSIPQPTSDRGTLEE